MPPILMKTLLNEMSCHLNPYYIGAILLHYIIPYHIMVLSKLEDFFIFIGALDIFNIFGISCHLAAVVLDLKNRRSREYHQPLFVCTWFLPWIVHSQLGLPILFRRFLWFDCDSSRLCSDCPVLRLFLLVHY